MGNFVGTKNRFGMYILHICYHLEYIWDSDWLIKFITYIGLPTQISIITDPAITMYWTNSSAFAWHQIKYISTVLGINLKCLTLDMGLISSNTSWVGPLKLSSDELDHYIYSITSVPIDCSSIQLNNGNCINPFVTSYTRYPPKKVPYYQSATNLYQKIFNA